MKIMVFGLEALEADCRGTIDDCRVLMVTEIADVGAEHDENIDSLIERCRAEFDGSTIWSHDDSGYRLLAVVD